MTQELIEIHDWILSYDKSIHGCMVGFRYEHDGITMVVYLGKKGILSRLISANTFLYFEGYFAYDHLAEDFLEVVKPLIRVQMLDDIIPTL